MPQSHRALIRQTTSRRTTCYLFDDGGHHQCDDDQGNVGEDAEGLDYIFPAWGFEPGRGRPDASPMLLYTGVPMAMHNIQERQRLIAV